MKYHFEVHAEETGYWAECLELPGCVSQGDTRDELAENLREAVGLYLEEPPESPLPVPLPNPKLSSNDHYLKIEVDPEIAFGVLLRAARLDSHLTQKQAAERLGMKSLYSYQRLEKRSNPTLSLIKRIQAVFPQIRLEQVL